MNSHSNDQKVVLNKGLQLEHSLPKLKPKYMNVKHIFTNQSQIPQCFDEEVSDRMPVKYSSVILML